MQYIIFDFDGTIADTFPIVEKISEDIAKRYHLQINAKEARKIGFKTALLKSKFSMWRLPQTVIEVRKRMAESIARDAKPIKNVKPVLISLSKKYKLGIVSSNSKQNVMAFLRRHQLAELFVFVYSDSSIFGKQQVLKRVCKTFNIDKKEVTYIGDEDRDIKAAKKAGINNIAVSWGFNDRSALEKAKPDVIISKPKQILKILPA